MKINRSTSAFVIPAVVWLVVLVGGGAMVAVPNFRPWNLFKKDPVAAANKDLAAAQADLKKAREEAAVAKEALAAAQKAELAQKDAQLRYSQQMASGAREALRTAPDAPQVRLAISLLDRTNHGLAVAIGGLPPDKQAEIVKIVSESLSGLADQLAAANASLASKDKELTVATTERTALKAQIPQLQSQLTAKDAAVTSQAAVVAQKTQAVVAQAEKLEAKEKEAGSLAAQANNLGWILIIAGVLYLLVHFLLPSLSQEFPGAGWLSAINKTTKSLTSAHI